MVVNCDSLVENPTIIFFFLGTLFSYLSMDRGVGFLNSNIRIPSPVLGAAPVLCLSSNPNATRFLRPTVFVSSVIPSIRTLEGNRERSWHFRSIDKMLWKKGPKSPPSSRGSGDATANEADNTDGLHRRLNNRQIQLIAIGGSIGTGLFITIGAGLAKGGPASLLLVFCIYASVVALVNNSIAEMSTYMPVSGGFIRLAGAWVDDALGFMVGWNFFLYQALLIPFEIVALNLVVSFWNDSVSDPGPTAAMCIAIIISYG